MPTRRLRWADTRLLAVASSAAGTPAACAVCQLWSRLWARISNPTVFAVAIVMATSRMVSRSGISVITREVGEERLVDHRNSGPDRRPGVEPGQRTVRNVDAAMAGVRPVLRARTVGVGRLPAGVVDEGSVADEFHRVVDPRVVIPERASRRPGRDHVIARILREDVKRAAVCGECRPAGRDRRRKERAAI